MRVIILAFQPDKISHVESHLSSLFPGAELDLDYVYPSLEVEDQAFWNEEVIPDLEERLTALERPFRVLQVRPAQFVTELVGSRPPGMIVISYAHWGDRVAMVANMLAIRNFPTMIIGHPD